MQAIEQSYKNKSFILDNGLSRGYSHMSDIWERDAQRGGLFTYRNLEQGIKSPVISGRYILLEWGPFFAFIPDYFRPSLSVKPLPSSSLSWS